MKIGKYGQQQLCWYSGEGEGGEDNDDEKLEFNEVTDEKMDIEIETLASEDCEVWATEKWWGEWGEYSSQLRISRVRFDKMNDDKQGHKDAKI